MGSGQVVKLSVRLRTVADLAGDDISSLADVGCDHGLLGISLLLEGRAAHVIGMDLREGPLSHARENAAASGLAGDRFETRLSDGLDRLTPGEADTIVIAGMGGVLMCDILSRGLEVARAAKRLVLSPQSHIESVREWLYASGFKITDEAMCRECGKFYTVMKAEPDKEEGTPLQPEPGTAVLCDEDLFFGPVLNGRGGKVYFDYITHMHEKAKKRLSQIAKGSSADDKREYFERVFESSGRMIEAHIRKEAPDA